MDRPGLIDLSVATVARNHKIIGRTKMQAYTGMYELFGTEVSFVEIRVAAPRLEAEQLMDLLSDGSVEIVVHPHR